MTWIWQWPQLVWVVLVALHLGISLAEHGKPRTPTNVIVNIIGVVLVATLLYYGGFFTEGRP